MQKAWLPRTQKNGEQWEKDDHPVNINNDHPVNNVEDMENSDLGSRVSIIYTHIQPHASEISWLIVCLVVSTILKNMSSSMGRITSHILKIKFMKPPTSRVLFPSKFVGRIPFKDGSKNPKHGFSPSSFQASDHKKCLPFLVCTLKWGTNKKHGEWS